MSALGFGFLPSAESCLDSGSAARAALPESRDSNRQEVTDL